MLVHEIISRLLDCTGLPALSVQWGPWADVGTIACKEISQMFRWVKKRLRALNGMKINEFITLGYAPLPNKALCDFLLGGREGGIGRIQVCEFGRSGHSIISSSKFQLVSVSLCVCTVRAVASEQTGPCLAFVATVSSRRLSGASKSCLLSRPLYCQVLPVSINRIGGVILS